MSLEKEIHRKCETIVQSGASFHKDMSPALQESFRFGAEAMRDGAIELFDQNSGLPSRESVTESLYEITKLNDQIISLPWWNVRRHPMKTRLRLLIEEFLSQFPEEQ